MLPYVGIAALLTQRSGFARPLGIVEWFDPLFFQYNVLLWTLFVLLIPAITYFYVQSMREEREERLRHELRAETWEERKEYVRMVIERQFGMSNYIGSTLTLMIVVAAGLAVLFLLKPLAAAGPGLDYSRGANLFLMGADMALPLPLKSGAYFARVIASLTAFQFGFLGAYVYFIQHLVRSYFTMDLTPNTFVAMSIRMVTAGLIALVLSFAFPPGGGALLPVVGFGIGYFPDWGLLAIAKLTRRALRQGEQAKSASTPLSELSGMSDDHEVRLRRQGYDSVENIAEANLVEMAVRTGFSYAQLRTWIGEAWLRVRMGAVDYPKLWQASGVRTADQFKLVFAGSGDNSSDAERRVDEVAASIPDRSLKVKIECVKQLLSDWHPEGRRIRQGH
jgi:hypothetical protein